MKSDIYFPLIILVPVSTWIVGEDYKTTIMSFLASMYPQFCQARLACDADSEVRRIERGSTSYNLLPMRFAPSLDANVIPDVVQYAYRIAPYKLWARRESILRAQEQQNIFLKDYFDREFALEKSFEAIRRYRSVTHRYPQIDGGTYELFSFLALSKLVHERLTKRGQEKLEGAVRDGLQNGLGPLAAELRTAGHLMGQEFDIEFTDLEERERYDLLASKDGLEIEIDCKAPSGDVGRQIHGQRFRTFANDLLPVLKEIALSPGGLLVHVTIPSNLHGDRGFERELAARVADLVRKSVPLEKPLTTTLKNFDLERSPFRERQPVSGDSVASFVEKEFGLKNVNAACYWAPGCGAAILILESQRGDRVVDGLYRQLKTSAQLQFSGERPAMLCVQMRDMTAAQLRELGKEPVNGLGAIANRLFSGSKRGHLAGISFVAPSGAITTSRRIEGDIMRTSHQDVGAAYVFTNSKNPSASAVDSVFRSAP